MSKLIRETFTEHGAPKAGTVYSDPATSHLYELFRMKGAVLWVGEIDGIVSGCCGIYPTEGLPEGYAELVKFYLLPASQGKGLGKALMDRNITSAKELGYQNIYLESLPEFAQAVNMYEKMSWALPCWTSLWVIPDTARVRCE